MDQKEKQIVEMAKDICDICHQRHNCQSYKYCTMAELVAEGLFEAGYRKQREGEWESYYGDYRCPCCKEAYRSEMLFIMESFPEGKLPDFCPNCGARMKGGVE